MEDNYKKIKEFLGNRVKENELLAKYTTFKIGGPADLFYEARDEEEFIGLMKLVAKLKVPCFILGNGSNTLAGDRGYRGLVVKNLMTGMKILGEISHLAVNAEIQKAPHKAVNPEKYLKVDDLDYPDEPLDVEIQVLSGTPLQGLIKWAFKNRLTGLQWFAGIPGTVGGAIVNNIHGYTRLFSNYIDEIKVLDKKGNIKRINRNEIVFDYDFSDIPQKYLAVISANLLMARGNLIKAEEVYEEWSRRKLEIQPQTNSPGSIFKNFNDEVAKKIGAPTPSAGWFIDQVGLKGKRIGNAQISPKHANFIVNIGGAKASDVVSLINMAKKAVKEKFGFELIEEIVKIGSFNPPTS